MSIKRTTVEQRKALPLASGVLDYFPDALLAIAEVSRVGNEQHHPGAPLHWDKSKSTDEADALMRHLLDRGTLDTDGLRHTAKVAWRALALLQRELDSETHKPHSVMPREYCLYEDTEEPGKKCHRQIGHDGAHSEFPRTGDFDPPQTKINLDIRVPDVVEFDSESFWKMMADQARKIGNGGAL